MIFYGVTILCAVWMWLFDTYVEEELYEYMFNLEVFGDGEPWYVEIIPFLSVLIPLILMAFSFWAQVRLNKKDKQREKEAYERKKILDEKRLEAEKKAAEEKRRTEIEKRIEEEKVNGTWVPPKLDGSYRYVPSTSSSIWAYPSYNTHADFNHD